MFPEHELVQSEPISSLLPPSGGLKSYCIPMLMTQLVLHYANKTFKNRKSSRFLCLFLFFFLLCPLLATVALPYSILPLHSTWTCVTSGDVLQIFMIGPEMWR